MKTTLMQLQVNFRYRLNTYRSKKPRAEPTFRSKLPEGPTSRHGKTRHKSRLAGGPNCREVKPT